MKLIDKDAVVEEIERLKECNHKICAGDFDFLKESYPEHYYSTEIYNDILSFIDTLEVKDVDSTNAFIEKATLWLLTNASDYCILHNSYDAKELVKDFVDAMKRE